MFLVNRAVLCAATGLQLCDVCITDIQSCVPSVELSLIGNTDSTLSPFVAQTMLCRHNLMGHPKIAQVSVPALSQEGFDGWWSPIEKLFGCMHFGSHNVSLVHSRARDGGPDGRLGAIMRGTQTRDEHLIRQLFKDYQALLCVLAQVQASLPSDTTHFPPVPLVLLSRFKDNLYPCGEHNLAY